MSEKPACHPVWEDLSYDDLSLWADARSFERGRAYQRRGAVLSVACSQTGVLSGRVSGGEVYKTLVRRDGPDLFGDCSCPVGCDCKHAVALVLEYLARVKGGQPVAQAEPPVDPKQVLEEASEVSEAAWEEYVEGLTPEELRALVLQLAAEYPEIRRRLDTRAALAVPDLPALIAGFREALQEASAEPGYSRHWSDDNYIPDYTLVREYLERLVELGEADLVLDLGLELLEAGSEQVEQSDDEGETGGEIGSALEPVWEALQHSSLTPAQRLLWLYDCRDRDDYGLALDQDQEDFEELEPQAWGEVAAELLDRLEADDAPEGWRREHVAERAAAALRRAGQEEQGRDLALQEARRAGNHLRTVALLIEMERLEEAQAAAREGLKTEDVYGGTHAELRQHLRELATRTGQHALAAAFVAEEFFRSPVLQGYCELREATEPLGLWPAVREQTLAALEQDRSAVRDESWPLPLTGLAPIQPQRWRPPTAVLLTEIALEEKRLDDALSWLRKARVRGHPSREDIRDRVARAVSATHPEEAIALWKDLVKECVESNSSHSYGASLLYLRPLRSLYASLQRQPQWEEYLFVLRQQYKRKRNFIAVLGTLRDGPILEQ